MQTISAHRSTIAQVALHSSGHLLATASEKGTVIRVFSVSDGTLLYSCRRGVARALIYCISFSCDAADAPPCESPQHAASPQLLCASASSGSIHIWELEASALGMSTRGASTRRGPLSRGHKLPFGGVEERSVVRVRLPSSPSTSWRLACIRTTPGADRHISSLFVVTERGILLSYTIDLTTKTCTLRDERRLCDE